MAEGIACMICKKCGKTWVGDGPIGHIDPETLDPHFPVITFSDLLDDPMVEDCQAHYCIDGSITSKRYE